MTYWATATPILALGATVNFADIDRNTLCISPDDIEHRINHKTQISDEDVLIRVKNVSVAYEGNEILKNICRRFVWFPAAMSARRG